MVKANFWITVILIYNSLGIQKPLITPLRGEIPLLIETVQPEISQFMNNMHRLICYFSQKSLKKPFSITKWLVRRPKTCNYKLILYTGAYLGGRCRGCAPPRPPEMTCGFLMQLIFCKKKTMWFIGVEVEQETSAPPPKKILDPPLL